MTWAEFRIRLHAYKRIEKKEWYKVREIAWNALIAPNANPKKIPKNKELFIPLTDNIKPSISDVMKERINEVKQEYFKQLENG